MDESINYICEKIKSARKIIFILYVFIAHLYYCCHQVEFLNLPRARFQLFDMNGKLSGFWLSSLFVTSWLIRQMWNKIRLEYSHNLTRSIVLCFIGLCDWDVFFEWRIRGKPLEFNFKLKNWLERCNGSFAGLTPLMLTAQLGNEEIARVLIGKGANVSATNENGDSALTLAALHSKH